MRCRLIRLLGLPAAARSFLVRCLIAAKFTWIAAVATEVTFDFKALRTEISLALVGQVAVKDCPRALVFEIFPGDPEFALE